MVIKGESAWLPGLQHSGVPVSNDHIYLTFNDRERTVAARDKLNGSTWDGLRMTVALVEPDARASCRQWFRIQHGPFVYGIGR